MSDSSEDEDMSRFREAVDDSFVSNFMKSKDQTGLPVITQPQKSERYLEESGHYNDFMVSPLVQKQVAQRVSSLIEKKIKFVDVVVPDLRVPEVDGGVRLFSDSMQYLSAEEPADTYTAGHNQRARAVRSSGAGGEGARGEADLKSVAVSPAHVLSGAETSCWKSRRREKLFNYKSKKGSKVLTAVD